MNAGGGKRTALVIHGGAWDIPADEREAHLAGVARSLERGRAMLREGASALETACACVKILEDDPTYDAGTGSHLTRDGVCELDALVMDGRDLSAGSIGAVRRIRNPVDAALEVLRHAPHLMLVGEGAERFWAGRGGALVEPRELVVPREQRRFDEGMRLPGSGGSTVGAVARDEAGHVAAATSTGGTLLKLPGRLGDTPLVGCGAYADDASGAVGSTGFGEAIIKVVLAKGVADAIARGLSPMAAARQGVWNLTRRTTGRAGVIAVNAAGEVGWAHTTPFMAVGAAWQGPDGAERTHATLVT